MSDSINIFEAAKDRFNRVVEDIANQLIERGRDPNVVLEAFSDRLKLRLLIDGTTKEWAAWTLAPEVLLGRVESWQLATWILAGWIEASSAGTALRGTTLNQEG